jgi:hypothetical protein
VRADLELWAYDYPLAVDGSAPEFVAESPMNTTLYDPFIDGHLISYYNREGVHFLDSMEGKRRDDLVSLIEPLPTVRHRVHELGTQRLLTLFNGGLKPARVRWAHGSRETETQLPARSFAQIELH